MCRGMRNFYGLKERRYTAHLNHLNEYLALFHERNDWKISMTDLNEILLNIMTNIWIKQAYVQEFYFEYIIFKN